MIKVVRVSRRECGPWRIARVSYTLIALHCANFPMTTIFLAFGIEQERVTERTVQAKEPKV